MKKIIILSFAVVLLSAGCSIPGIKGSSAKNLKPEEAKTKIVDFIKNNLVQEGTEVSVKEISEDNGLYKVIINLSGGQEITSYMTKDGAKFFPQVMDVAEVEKKKEDSQNSDTASKPEAAQAPKAAKAKVELFVMSHCPYGTQIEKGIIPVIETLKDKMDFELKFCDYAMHGKKELDEQLNQYCIQKNEPAKLVPYLKCFLGEADAGPKCLKEAKIDDKKLKDCVAKTDKEFKVTEGFNDKNSWESQFPPFNVFKADADKYGVSGSPTLVINGEKISSARDSDSLLKTICSGFENPPAECETELSAASPSAGFGYSTTDSATDAGCGS